MRTKKTTTKGRSIAGFICALALLLCAFVGVASAQEAGRRSVRALSSEDLLNRPVLYVPQPTPSSVISSSDAAGSVGITSYRDPAGAFTLNFPNGNWYANKRAGSAGRMYKQRSFRRIEAEGFASATANVYVLTDSKSLPITDPFRLPLDAQRDLASLLVSRFVSSNSSLVSVEPLSSNSGSRLRIIADQTIARRVAVRASITVFERQGRFFVVVCCASPETFDTYSSEFEVIADSLASSVMRP
jgi:hypothetical protein